MLGVGIVGAGATVETSIIAEGSRSQGLKEVARHGQFQFQKRIPDENVQNRKHCQMTIESEPRKGMLSNADLVAVVRATPGGLTQDKHLSRQLLRGWGNAAFIACFGQSRIGTIDVE